MPRRTRNLFDPSGTATYRLSRSKLEQFKRCPRCFYLDRRVGIQQPPGFPFNLNSAVDHLLKKEFDGYRQRGEAHPLMQDAGIDAIPAPHEQLDEWRNNFLGVKVHHAATNLEISGAIDDLWVTGDSTYAVVDYKATSKNDRVNIDAPWQKSYKRQMEIYQWLLRGNGLTVSKTGYFVYCNGKRDRPGFNGRLEFDIDVISYEGNDGWVEGCILKAHECLMQDEPPTKSASCEFCDYSAMRGGD
ncbi:MAG TPA: PD-(D/E)XK nuclease family protein [Vicinamibacterales bacterium]|nr:PD-(D/E)XK nuclease family protein [Vicinamibacterales bacterium]